MAGRFVQEYCPHCGQKVECVWTGNRLNCTSHDHYVRRKYPKRGMAATAPEPMVVKETKGAVMTVPVAKPVQLRLFE